MVGLDFKHPQCATSLKEVRKKLMNWPKFQELPVSVQKEVLATFFKAMW
jgi:hypothetical protein